LGHQVLIKKHLVLKDTPAAQPEQTAEASILGDIVLRALDQESGELQLEAQAVFHPVSREVHLSTLALVHPPSPQLREIYLELKMLTKGTIRNMESFTTAKSCRNKIKYGKQIFKIKT
jgi:hypothetical protein